MSERGSFVTEFIYCKKCFETAKNVLLRRDRGLCSQALDSWIEGKEIPIIAGMVGGLYPQEEIDVFEFEFKEKLETEICHQLRIAVVAEEGYKLIVIDPIGESDGRQ